MVYESLVFDTEPRSSSTSLTVNEDIEMSQTNSVEHEGGCLCGKIRYSIHGAPTYSGNCHCCDCRRAVGAGVVTWIGIKPENFEITRGDIRYCAGNTIQRLIQCTVFL